MAEDQQHLEELHVPQPELQQEIAVSDQEAEYQRAQEAYAAMSEADILHEMNIANLPERRAALYNRLATKNDLREFVGAQVLPTAHSHLPEVRQAQESVLFTYLRDRLAKGYLWYQPEEQFVPTTLSAERAAITLRRRLQYAIAQQPRVPEMLSPVVPPQPLPEPSLPSPDVIPRVQAPETLSQLTPALQSVLNNLESAYIYAPGRGRRGQKPKDMADVWLHDESRDAFRQYAHELVVQNPHIGPNAFRVKLRDQVRIFSRDQARGAGERLQRGGVNLIKSQTKEIEASLLRPETFTLLELVAKLTHEVNGKFDFNLTSTVRPADHDLSYKNPDSAHPKGLAFDFQLSDSGVAWGDAEQRAQIVQYLIALEDQTKDPSIPKGLVTVLFECPKKYRRRNPFPPERTTWNDDATGIHIHVQINADVLARMTNPTETLRTADAAAKAVVATRLAANKSGAPVASAVETLSVAEPQPAEVVTGEAPQIAGITDGTSTAD